MEPWLFCSLHISPGFKTRQTWCHGDEHGDSLRNQALALIDRENGVLSVIDILRQLAVALLELGQAIYPLGDPDKIGRRGEYTVTKEDEMLRHYKEIFYGLIFGLGAACIDTFVDASTEHKAFWDFGPGMLLIGACSFSLASLSDGSCGAITKANANSGR